MPGERDSGSRHRRRGDRPPPRSSTANDRRLRLRQRPEWWYAAVPAGRRSGPAPGDRGPVTASRSELLPGGYPDGMINDADAMGGVGRVGVRPGGRKGRKGCVLCERMTASRGDPSAMWRASSYALGSVAGCRARARVAMASDSERGSRTGARRDKRGVVVRRVQATATTVPTAELAAAATWQSGGRGAPCLRALLAN